MVKLRTHPSPIINTEMYNPQQTFPTSSFVAGTANASERIFVVQRTNEASNERAAAVWVGKIVLRD